MKTAFRFRSGTFVAVFIAALGIVLLLVFSKAASDGIIRGLDYSVKMLVPSLFPFMLLSSFMIRSGASDSIGKMLSFMVKKLFCLPGEAAAAIFLSFTGGFPAGASCVKALYQRKKLSSVQAEQMMMFCVCSGPAFLITGVGTILMHNTVSGVILYSAQLISGIILGIISGRIYKGSESPLGSQADEKNLNHKEGIGDSFILACSDAAGSVLGLTAMVAAFNMIISVCSELGIPKLLGGLIGLLSGDEYIADKAFVILTEVTSACNEAVNSGCPLWVISLAVGFGGLCVHFQIFSILGNIKINKKRFFVFRAMNAFLSSVIVYTVCRFRQDTAEVFAQSGAVRAEVSSVSAVGACALIIMSIVFVLSIRRNGARRY